VALRQSFLKLRIAQVRAVSAGCAALARIPAAAPVLEWLAGLPGVERSLVGFRRGFATKAEAERCAAGYGFGEHEHPGAIRRHLALAERTRPSDYAVLFHLARLLPQVTRIIDLGGNVGNLFYSYDRYLHLPGGFRWTVVEIAPVAEAGTAIARERGERRLRFVTSLSEAVDGSPDSETVLLVSGALHYFEQPLGTLIAEAGALPKHVIINRSPVSEHGTVVGIQDGGEYVTTARILDRGTLLTSMAGAGYRLEDEWVAAELNMRLPLRPRRSVEHYSGFLFRRE
jgi:putative methyltransferase (TIGR04325 family)